MIPHRSAGEQTIVVLLVLAMGACTKQPPPPDEQAAPGLLIGEFVDDYGIRYTIDAERWVQHPNANYLFRAWHSDDQFVVAKNDSANPSDGGLWTRIDWVLLEGSDDYEWAFCYAAYQATTPEDAVSAPATERATPRTGCNGFPFSRMMRVNP